MALADELTRVHRRHQAAVRAQAVRELAVLYPALDLSDLDGSWPRFLVAVSALVQRHRRRSAGIASAYMRAMRRVHNLEDTAAGMRLAEPLEPERLATSLHVTSVAATKRAIRAGQTAPAAQATGLVVSAGAVARHVLNGGRETLMRSAVAMPDAKGWRRVASGSACTFCRTLAGRDELYTSGTTAEDFGAHDHCSCSVEPVFWQASGAAAGDYRRRVEPYTPSERSTTPAFARAEQRAYLGE